MNTSAKITKVGNSSAVILPREIMEKFHLAQGDVVTLTASDTGVLMTPYDAKKSRQLDMAREIMRDNRNMLKKLAE